MLKKLTKIKNLIGKVFLVAGILALALFTKASYNNTKAVFAINKEDCSTEFLTTPDFYSTSSSNITSSSHWSAITPSDETNSSSFKKGIVNIERIEERIKADETETNNKEDGTIVDNLWSYYGLFTSPGKVSNVSLDDEDQKGINNYLMINAYNFSGHMGYESDDFTLEKGSFYKIAVTLKTINAEKEVEVKENSKDELTTETRKSDASAAIYLKGISDSKQPTKFEHIKTNNAWKTYYFYINTSSFTSEKNISLQLYLGNEVDSCQGAVFFSDVKIQQYSEAEYIKEFTPSIKEKTNVHEISLNTSYVYDLINNASFESNLNTWKTIGSAVNGDIFTTIVDTSSTGHIKGNAKYPLIPSNNNTSSDNIKALAIYSKPNSDTSTYYGVESNTFVVEQYKLYRVSVWAYSESESNNGAYISIIDKDNEETKVTTQVSTTKSSNNLANNWTEYEFYIQGHSLRDTNLKIQLSIGTKDKKDDTTNYVIFDDIRVQEINYTQFNAGKSDTNTLSLTPAQDSSYLIANNGFDIIENNDEDGIKPLTPASWTLENSSSYVFAGVVNTEESHFANNVENYGEVSNIVNPGKVNSNDILDSNNVLMMGTAKKNQNISYKTTNTFTLSASSYYQVSFDVYTQHLSQSNKGANFTILDSNNVEILNIENIKTNNEWQHYTFYISTDLTEKTCNAILSLNNVDAYVYFDNIKLVSIEKDLYNELKETKDESLFTDLSKNQFGSPSLWTSEGNSENVTISFIKSSDYDLSVNNEGIAHLVADVEDVAYFIAKKDKLSISASSFYKISVYINTKDIKKFESDDNNEYGASFFIRYNEKTEGIENIVTNDNDFTQYIIYFQSVDAVELEILVGLGSENNMVAGEAAFTNLEITKFDNEEAMNADIESNNNLVTKTIKAEAKPAEPSDPTDEEETPYTATPNWLAISSLITSAAMIVAIFAYLLRKINFKKKKTKTNTTYDRRKTLDKRYDLNERIEYREDLISKLKSEHDEISATKDAYKKAHEDKMQALKSSADASSESLRKELDNLYNQKLEISKQHNKIIAQDKLNASKEEDIQYNEKIQKIEAQEKVLTKKIKQIEKACDKEQNSYDELIARANKRQDDINAEIKAIKREIETYNAELIALNTGNNNKKEA